MKTITCKELGGNCEAPLSAETKDEMMTVGWEHMKSAHPEEAAKIEAAPKDDPATVAWEAHFDKTWEEAKAA